MRKLQYNPGFKAECPTIMQNEQLMYILSLYPFPQDLHRFCPGCKGVRGGARRLLWETVVPLLMLVMLAVSDFRRSSQLLIIRKKDHSFKNLYTNTVCTKRFRVLMFHLDVLFTVGLLLQTFCTSGGYIVQDVLLLQI